MTFEDDLAAARQKLESGDPGAALQTLRRLLAFPARELSENAEGWQKVVALVGEVCGVTAADGSDFETLLELAVVLRQQEAHGGAATLLTRACQLQPDDPALLAHLASALMACQMFGEAARSLRRYPHLVESDHQCRYFLAYNSLMCGNLEEPLRLLQGFPTQVDETLLPFLDALRSSLHRADRVRQFALLDDQDLRGWHYVLSGSLLLRPARYEFWEDSPESCREALAMLFDVLDSWGFKPERIFSLNDPDSATLAYAAAKLLQLPVVAWPEGGSTQAGLVPIYDAASLSEEILAGLSEYHPNQLIWSHASRYRGSSVLAGDFTTYLYRHHLSPWAERLVVDKGFPKKVPQDDRPPAQRAEDICKARPPASLELGGLRDFVQRLGRPPHRSGPRPFQPAGSPVACSWLSSCI